MHWGTIAFGAFLFVAVVLPVIIKLLEALHRARPEKDGAEGLFVLPAMKSVALISATVIAWGWSLLAGVGGLMLLIHQGPLPVTNGWFAMFSGTAACPLTGSFLRKCTGATVSIGAQLIAALLIFVAGRVAVVFVLHRPFLPQ